MKVGILAGGLGTRLSEETVTRPKPMVEIGGLPIIWHIMKMYEAAGMIDFVVACGYKGEFIKRWFVDAVRTSGNVAVDFADREVEHSELPGERVNWRVELIETGLETGTGGRIKRLQPHLGDGTCMITWGDGVSDIDLRALLDFHRSHGKFCTMTAVRPPARFGHIEVEGDRVVAFNEKPQTGEGWVNGAFFVLEPSVFAYIDDDSTMFERSPLERLAQDGQLMAYRHYGFWQCMDTMRDRVLLENLWATDPPWWKGAGS